MVKDLFFHELNQEKNLRFKPAPVSKVSSVKTITVIEQETLQQRAMA